PDRFATVDRHSPDSRGLRLVCAVSQPGSVWRTRRSGFALTVSQLLSATAVEIRPPNVRSPCAVRYIHNAVVAAHRGRGIEIVPIRKLLRWRAICCRDPKLCRLPAIRGGINDSAITGPIRIGGTVLDAPGDLARAPSVANGSHPDMSCRFTLHCNQSAAIRV